MGIIELYEGLEQTDAEKFDSYVGIKNPLQVSAQSYVFAQGVSAMAASETGNIYIFKKNVFIFV